MSVCYSPKGYLLSPFSLAKPERTSPPTQLQFSHTAHTEFVICDYAIEDAYAIVKRLLGLAYFYGGAQNAVEMQVWATWLLYAVLVDLTDAVAEALNQPFAAISMEMVYRSLYYFTQAYQRGQATDVVDFLATNARLYGIVKRPRKRSRRNLLLELSHLTNLCSP